MDRKTAYRNQMPYETDFMLGQRYAYEALGIALLHIFGPSTVVGGLAAAPTSPASLSVTVGPGAIYSFEPLEPTDWGKLVGTGGLDADTNPDHKVLKQGLLRDTQTFTITPPATSGHSQVFLIQAQFQSADDIEQPAQFYNVSNPNAPIVDDVSQDRRDKCNLGIKAGTSATTGTQTVPAADAGWFPLWNITVANGASTITAPNIVQNAGAPLIDLGSGGGGGGTGLRAWAQVAASASYTAVTGDRLVVGQGATVTLPASPAFGDQVDVIGDFSTGSATVARNGKTIGTIGGVKQASNLTLNEDNLGARLVYVGGDHWHVDRGD